MIGTKPVIIAVFLLLIFWPLAFLLERQMLFDLVNSMAVSYSFAVLISYFPGIKKAASTPREELETGHFLILGAVLLFLYIEGRTVWMWTWRWLGEPEGGLDHIFLAWIATFVVCGAILFLLSPKIKEGDVPKDGYTHLTWATFAGLLMFLGTVLLRWRYM